MGSLLTSLERVLTTSIATHPQNARVGNVEAIADSLTRNDQFAPIVVQASTRYVLAGNHTLLAARRLGWREIDAVLVDVDDTAARRIMLAANRTPELGTYDPDALAELLSYMDNDYLGTGFTDYDVQQFLHPTVFDDEHAITALGPDDVADDEDVDRGGRTRLDDQPQMRAGAREDDTATPGGSFVQLSWLVPAEQANTVRSALTAARVRWELDTLGEGLAALCGHFLAEQRRL